MLNKLMISLIASSVIVFANGDPLCKPVDNKNIKKLYQNIDTKGSKTNKQKINTNGIKSSGNKINIVDNVNYGNYNNEIIELKKELVELKKMNKELSNKIDNRTTINNVDSNNINNGNNYVPYSKSLKESSDKFEQYKKENNILANENVIKNNNSNVESSNNKISFGNKNQDDVLEYLVNNLNKINQKIDSIENNVIEYKYKGDFDPSEYSKYKVTSKMLVEVDKGGKITNVYTKGTELIGKKDGKTLIVGSDGYVDVNGVEEIKN